VAYANPAKGEFNEKAVASAAVADLAGAATLADTIAAFNALLAALRAANLLNQ
jgi:hypothetical protein